MALRRKRSELGRGDRVIAVKTLGRIPEGTRGVIQLVDGFAWTRYWVLWEGGDWTGSVDKDAVVAAGRYEAYKQEQADAATRAPVAAASAPAADAAPAKASGGSGIPEHLLERSRLARERKAAAAG